MPRYTSDTSRPVGQIYINAGQPTDSYEFIQNLPVGVVVDKTQYLFDPVIDSVKISSTTTYTIPATTTGYLIKLYCLSGEVAFQVNTTGKSTLLGAGMSWNCLQTQRNIETIKFTITTGVVYVTIEKA